MWDGQPVPTFLTLQEVLDLHQEQIELFGGESGIINLGSVDSSINQPKATFGGEFLHKDIFEMAAAYLFHLVSNHGFADGNKRIGLVAAAMFLAINGLEIEADPDELAELVLRVAKGELEIKEVSQYLRTHCQPSADDI